MYKPLLIFLSLASALAVQPAEQYYKELNCKPILSSDGVTKYDCSLLDGLNKEACFLDGVNYKDGEGIPKEVLVDTCVAGCSCSVYSGEANLRCANIECPSLFRPTYKEGCIDVYEKGTCCPVGKHCEKTDPPLPTCEYNGKTYKKGEKFSPEEDKCKSCLCMEGFNGTLSEPWCSNIKCGMYLHYGSRLRDNCIPTYYKTSDCCPIPVWRCPSEDDEILSDSLSSTTKSSDEMCHFGKLLLAPGQKLNRSQQDKCVECSCMVPPHISCVMDTKCYEG